MLRLGGERMKMKIWAQKGITQKCYEAKTSCLAACISTYLMAIVSLPSTFFNVLFVCIRLLARRLCSFTAQAGHLKYE